MTTSIIGPDLGKSELSPEIKTAIDSTDGIPGSGITIGYEQEVLRGSLGWLKTVHPKLIGNRAGDRDEYIIFEELSSLIKGTGFNYGFDGLFELQSFAYDHPYVLHCANLAINRTGILPPTSNGVVTSHVSIGFKSETKFAELDAKDIYPSCETFRNSLTVLRTAELLGSSSIGRLVNGVIRDGKTWGMCGVGGVNIKRALSADWQGDNDTRIEYRTLRYKNPEQFGATLETLYYLSLAMLNDGLLRDEFDNVQDCLADLFDSNFVPNHIDWVAPLSLTCLDIDDKDYRRAVFNEYIHYFMKPYIEYLRSKPDVKKLQQSVIDAVINIREELGWQNTPSVILGKNK